MRVSLRPRCITHYRNSVGLISTRCGKLMDRPPQSLPAPFNPIASLRAAQCGVATALSGAMSLPMEIVPLYGRAVEVLAATRWNRQRTMHSPPVGNAKQVFAAALSRQIGKYRCDPRSCALSRRKFAPANVCFYLHKTRCMDAWFIVELGVRNTVAGSYFVLIFPTEVLFLSLLLKSFDINLYMVRYPKKMSISYVYIYWRHIFPAYFFRRTPS